MLSEAQGTIQNEEHDGHINSKLTRLAARDQSQATARVKTHIKLEEQASELSWLSSIFVFPLTSL